MGGYERGFGVFVEKVEAGSKASEVGLKRGDQVRIETNYIFCGKWGVDCIFFLFPRSSR